MVDAEAERIAALQSELGPGGVETPTQEVGGTPTPQEEDTGGSNAAAPAALKPITELLGKGTDTPAEEDKLAEEPPTTPKSDDVGKRINKLTAEKWEEKRAREAAEARAKLAEETLAELARLNPDAQTGGTKPAETAATLTRAEIESRAAQLTAANEFNRSVNEEVLKGRAAHADYDTSIDGLRKITGPVIPSEFIAAALETGAAAEVFYELGRDLNEADRILSLPPIKQAVALARYAEGLKGKFSAVKAAAEAPANVSKAPPPITPKIGGSARKEMDISDPQLPLAEFIRRRNEQELQLRKRA